MELRVNQRVSTHPSDSARLPAPLRSVRSARARTAVRVSAEADGCSALLSERLNPDFHPVCKRHCQSDVRPALPTRGGAALLALRCRPRWYAETPPRRRGPRPVLNAACWDSRLGCWDSRLGHHPLSRLPCKVRHDGRRRVRCASLRRVPVRPSAVVPSSAARPHFRSPHFCPKHYRVLTRALPVTFLLRASASME